MTESSRRPGSVVVGLDASIGSRLALDWAAAYARAADLPLTAVHVRRTDGGLGHVWTPGLSALTYTQGVGESSAAPAHIRSMFESCRPDAAWTLEIVEGSPGAVLTERSESAELLVVGTREHTGVDRALIGSTSSYCVSHASCPVVAVPPPASATPAADDLRPDALSSVTT